MTEKTLLECIEAERTEHIAGAIRAALFAHGVKLEDLPKDALHAASEAAIAAGNRFPADRNRFPFDNDLNNPPEDMPKGVCDAITRIDAGIFSADTFYATEHHLYLAAHLQRWEQELRKWRRDDDRNRPDIEGDPQA